MYKTNPLSTIDEMTGSKDVSKEEIE